ncbi:AAA family ATPase [Infirmifilum sp. NZ]|uniref:AAA family ATPase n=1 Tax=Infirmifilum sp. NZ TaxID=2926850 RepID=UPI0027A7AF77|nr:AAA family ATPase [Infirmifilum sp. NZ]UNQ72798.1 hypothetical protein MOV14_06690 [Infirmifilum sp. NZ]
MSVSDVLGILPLPPYSRRGYARQPPVLRLRVGAPSLDSLLSGGLEPGCVYDFTGEAGSGKTQLCMQLSVNVQLQPDSGGLGKRAVYIDTRGDFSPERVVAMALTRGLEPSEALGGITYARALSLQHLLVLLDKSLQEVVAGDAGLLVVDELTGLLRSEALDARERTEAYSSVVRALWRVAKAGCVVVATRDVVSADGLSPAGGAHLDTYACLSVMLRRRGELRDALALSSPWSRASATFRIGEGGVEEP